MVFVRVSCPRVQFRLSPLHSDTKGDPIHSLVNALAYNVKLCPLNVDCSACLYTWWRCATPCWQRQWSAFYWCLFLSVEILRFGLMCKGVRDVGARAALTCWPGGQKFDSASGRNWKTIDIGRQLDSLNSVTGKIHGIVKATHHLHMYTSPTECRLTIHLTHWKIPMHICFDAMSSARSIFLPLL